MEKEKDKKGLFKESKKAKKGSCCCNFEIEEIPDDDIEEEKDSEPKQES